MFNKTKFRVEKVRERNNKTKCGFKLSLASRDVLVINIHVINLTSGSNLMTIIKTKQVNSELKN